MFVNLNGILIASSQNHLHHSNRAFRYGDGIFESMSMFNQSIELLTMHAQRLALGAQMLEFNLPEQLNEHNISGEIEKLRIANQLTNARIRIVLFRAGEGFYAPTKNGASFIIESVHSGPEAYTLNTKGLDLGLYTEILKPLNILSSIKSCNALLYVKAGLFKSKWGFEECILFNERKEVCESISNNVFWIKDKIIYTPSTISGCILGVMRRHLLQQLEANNFEFFEGEFQVTNLLEADELFLSSATRGIQWVRSLSGEGKKKLYTNIETRNIFETLLEKV